MRLPDRVTGLFLVGLGSLAAYGGWLLPPVPGQPVGPNVFPMVIGIGLAICGLMIAFGIGHTFEEEEELSRSRPGSRPPRRAGGSMGCVPCCRPHCSCSMCSPPSGSASSLPLA